MEIIDVSSKFLLETMFERIGLPRPRYFCRRLENGKCAATIEFFPTAGDLQGVVSRSSDELNDMSAAMNNTAARVIRCMEICKKKLLVDHSYSELGQV